MPRVMPILFKLQQPFEAKGFAPLFPVQYRTTATPAVAMLADNFDDNSRDATKWNLGSLKVNATAGATVVAETNQRLEITPVTAPSGNTYSGYISASVYDLTGSSAYVKIQGSDGDSFGNEITAVEAYIGVGTDQNNAYLALINCLGTCQIRQQKAGVESNVGSSFAYSASTHAWLRLRFDATNVYLDTAPRSASDPPVSGDWTNQVSGTRDVAIDISQSFLAIGAGSYSGGAVPTVYFDGFNTATTTGAAAYSLSCTTGTFALAGNALTPAVAMQAATGSFVLTGNALAPAVTMPAAVGSFTLTGTAVTPAVALPAATGAFSLTGRAATLTHGYSLVAARGTFTLTSNATALEVGHVFTAATGTFAVTGRTMTPAVAMAATTGTFSLTGNSVTPAVAVPLSTGVFSLSGTAATLKAARLLTATTSTFSVNTTATTLAVTMSAARGTFALTGIAATPKVAMSATTGVFALAGNVAGLNKTGSSTLTAVTGIFTLSGNAAALARAARQSAATGVFAVTGTNAAFPATRRLMGLTGAFSLTGSAAGLAVRFPALAAQFVLSGFAAGQALARHLSGAAGSFVITGRDLEFVDFNPSARTYPLAGVEQPYPGTAATYPLVDAQGYPLDQAQTYPLEGIPQQYPLAS